MKINKKINKKAGAQGYLISVMIIVLSFFIYLGFMANIQTKVATGADDLSCRVFVSMKDTKIIKTSEYFFEMKQRCKLNEPIDYSFEKDELENSNNKLLNSMSRCWYRYGEGKFDFLSDLKVEGNWCFICGEVRFDDPDSVVSYKDFIHYAQKKKYNDSMTYADYINLKYSDVSGNEMLKIRTEFKNLLIENKNDNSFKEILKVVGDKLTYVDDLSSKKIDGKDKKMYIVYRYDRIPKDFTEKIEDASKNMMIGIGGSIAFSMLAEGLAEAAIFGTSAGIASGGILAIPGAIFGFVKGSIKSVIKSGEAITKVLRINKLLKKIISLIKLTKKVEKFGEFSEEITKIMVKGEKLDILRLSEKLEDTNDFKKPLENMYKTLEHYKIDSIEDIDKVIIQKNFKISELEKQINTMKKVTKNQQKKGTKINNLAKYKRHVEDLEKLGDEVTIILENAKQTGNPITKTNAVKIKDYFRTFAILSPGVIGAVGSSITNSNYNQYVDLMTREQYYRNCGTQRFNIN